jgi:hypothetical protein
VSKIGLRWKSTFSCLLPVHQFSLLVSNAPIDPSTTKVTNGSAISRATPSQSTYCRLLSDRPTIVSLMLMMLHDIPPFALQCLGIMRTSFKKIPEEIIRELLKR